MTGETAIKMYVSDDEKGGFTYTVFLSFQKPYDGGSIFISQITKWLFGMVIVNIQCHVDNNK